MKYLIPIALLAASPAYAQNDNTNSANNSSQALQNTGTINGSTINNGAGAGSTLAGGSATATGGSATGGSVTGSGNSTSVNTALGGTGGTGVGGSQSQSATTGSQSIYVEAQKRNPVATAYAAPLVAADDTCMGSSSVGAQGIGLGLSVGSTWKDDDCVRRKDAREIHNMGFKPAAITLMCQNAQVRKAMSDAGTPCVGEYDEAEFSEARPYPTKGWNDSPKH